MFLKKEPYDHEKASNVFYNYGMEETTASIGYVQENTVVFCMPKATESFYLQNKSFMVKKSKDGFVLYPQNEECLEYFENTYPEFLLVEMAQEEGLNLEDLTEDEREHYEHIKSIIEDQVGDLSNIDRGLYENIVGFLVPYEYFEKPQNDFLFTNVNVYLFMLEPNSFLQSFRSFMDHYPMDVLNLQIDEIYDYVYVTNLYKVAVSIVGNLLGVDKDVSITNIDFESCNFSFVTSVDKMLIARLIKTLFVAIGIHLDDIEIRCTIEKDKFYYTINVFKENFYLIEEIDTTQVSKNMNYSNPYTEYDDGDIINE